MHTLNEIIDLLLTNSIYTEGRLREIGVTCPFKCFIGGVNTAALKTTKALDPKCLTIFCAARFVPYKHHAVMIDLRFCRVYSKEVIILVSVLKKVVTMFNISPKLLPYFKGYYSSAEVILLFVYMKCRRMFVEEKKSWKKAAMSLVLDTVKNV